MNKIRTMPFREIRAQFSFVAYDVQHKKIPYMLTKNNKPAFVLMPVEDVELLDILVEKNRHLKEVQGFIRRRSEGEKRA